MKPRAPWTSLTPVQNSKYLLQRLEPPTLSLAPVNPRQRQSPCFRAPPSHFRLRDPSPTPETEAHRSGVLLSLRDTPPRPRRRDGHQAGLSPQRLIRNAARPPRGRASGRAAGSWASFLHGGGRLAARVAFVV